MKSGLFFNFSLLSAKVPSSTKIKIHLYFLNGKAVFRREDTGRVSLSWSLLVEILKLEMEIKPHESINQSIMFTSGGNLDKRTVYKGHPQIEPDGDRDI